MNFTDFHIDFVSPINEVVNQFSVLLEIYSHNDCVFTRNILNNIMMNYDKLLGKQMKLQ